MMSSLFPKSRPLSFMPLGDKTTEVASRCLPLRQLLLSNLSRVAMQWLELELNLQPSGYKA